MASRAALSPVVCASAGARRTSNAARRVAISARVTRGLVGAWLHALAAPGAPARAALRSANMNLIPSNVESGPSSRSGGTAALRPEIRAPRAPRMLPPRPVYNNRAPFRAPVRHRRYSGDDSSGRRRKDLPESSDSQRRLRVIGPICPATHLCDRVPVQLRCMRLNNSWQPGLERSGPHFFFRRRGAKLQAWGVDF